MERRKDMNKKKATEAIIILGSLTIASFYVLPLVLI